MYNGNLEWSLTIRDAQYGPLVTGGPADLMSVMDQIGGMLSAPLGDPRSPYDARGLRFAASQRVRRHFVGDHRRR